eukprot:m.33487 g.33487  ORF g.33487 m.33487 type:complete len:99 (+) comp31818_c0_seq2:58-354(+)
MSRSQSTISNGFQHVSKFINGLGKVKTIVSAFEEFKKSDFSFAAQLAFFNITEMCLGLLYKEEFEAIDIEDGLSWVRRTGINSWLFAWTAVCRRSSCG